MHVLRGILGVAVLLVLLVVFSQDRRAINWRLVAGGLLLQLALAACFFGTEVAAAVVEPLAGFFVKVTDYSAEGARMVFGKLVDLPTMGGLFGRDGAFVFAFQVLPTIIFFSALTSVLYYCGILQRIVFGCAWVMKRVMRLSGAESLAAAGEVFLGQTESALLVKPYVARMTRSEVCTMMIGGMATIAGGVMAAYIGMLGGDQEIERLKFARWLLCASGLPRRSPSFRAGRSSHAPRCRSCAGHRRLVCSFLANGASSHPSFAFVFFCCIHGGAHGAAHRSGGCSGTAKECGVCRPC
jgi:CNT family concentrative nucleoside transporter